MLSTWEIHQFKLRKTGFILNEWMNGVISLMVGSFSSAHTSFDGNIERFLQSTINCEFKWCQINTELYKLLKRVKEKEFIGLTTPRLASTFARNAVSCRVQRNTNTTN